MVCSANDGPKTDWCDLLQKAGPIGASWEYLK